MPLDRAGAEALFIESLETIERILGKLCRRYGVSGDEQDEFCSWAKSRLIDNDYGVLRQFRGESSTSTYLVVVIATLFREYRVQRWGRWRPSAAARRSGTVVLQLEQLLLRDRLPFRQAAETLRTKGVTILTDRELWSLVSVLPSRAPLRPDYVRDEALGEMVSDKGADVLVATEAAQVEHHSAVSALDEAIAREPPEDRLILRLRFWENMGVADIARTLRIEQKPLYRRLAALLVRLRRNLESVGVSRSMVAELVAVLEEERS
jgi:RNA polymerase sigma factor for flagellar operon FliA